MDGDDRDVDWRQAIREMIADATETDPTEPGIYKMPCGECVVDFFITAEGEERWLVAGDERSYTREAVAIARHGDHPWQRLYPLADPARHIASLADAGGNVDRVLNELIRTIEDREIERVVRDRVSMDQEPLDDVAKQFGIDLDEI
ncbi:hypothetical protein [Microbacterium hominis]|uniref:hypothetical protein n=1 Tax=Microbacterium hominis TaxID=162426 RepID=UPI0007684EDD|nr:hypothetical protein [Microbacterium hominis]KXC04456.1 zinc ABC transporter ATPase [Microbacterium hominis]